MYAINTLHLTDLTIEHLTRPLGIDVVHPRFSWKLVSTVPDTFQTSYRVRIYREDLGARPLVADTGDVASDRSIEVVVPGFEAEPQTRYTVEATSCDNHGHTASAESIFETGRMGRAFASHWVEPIQEPTPSSIEEAGDAHAEPTAASAEAALDPLTRGYQEFRPAQYVRIPFSAKKLVSRARVYATAHGIYELTVNGKRPDDRVFAPEHTPYHKVLLYQTYDVTDLLNARENALGIVLADGWWAGRVGTTGDSCQYGNTLQLLLDLELTYADGTREVVTAERGVSHEGQIRHADLFVGEEADARLETPGWDEPEFDDADWTPVRIVNPADSPALIGQDLEPVRPVARFVPERIFTAPNGDLILDAGQVVAGVLEITLDAPAGARIALEHTEVLDADGNFFNNILNTNKDQADFYTTRAGHQTWCPRFTYHGFRYVRITGWPGTPALENFKVVVYASDLADRASLTTSDARLNQLVKNIRWSQRGNTVSIPTDCPSREKAGWTGDIMVYAPTMTMLSSADAHLRSWMRSLRAEQLPSGAVPMIVPYLTAYRQFLSESLGSHTSSGWGDAVVMVPLALWRAYGDRRALEENYPAMQRWLSYIEHRAATCHPDGYEAWPRERQERDRYLWNTDYHFGDWLIPSIVIGNPDAYAMNRTAEETMGIVGPAFFAFTAREMAEAARALGQTEDEKRYRALYEHVRAAFIAEYLHEDGSFDADFQGIYVIALELGLVTDELRPAMMERLVRMIEANGWRLDTGFLSVPLLMDVLCDNGRADVAHRLLMQTGCPSWLYEVEHGATTMWESWGAIDEDGTVSSYSFNHYAFGCVADWMFRRLAGITATEPAWKRMRIEPDLACGLTHVEATIDTPHGTVHVRWEKVCGEAFVAIDIPCNAQAEVVLPGCNAAEVTSGHHAYVVSLNE